MRILVISDDTGESDYLAGAVTRRGCEVVTVTSMRDAVATVDVGADVGVEVDVALLQLESSEVSVVYAVETLRAETDLPLVVLAARPTSDRCAEVLLAGADDYVARSVSIDELMARIQVLLRRHRRRHESGGSSWRLVAGDVEIDLERRSVTVADRAVDLTEKEFKILSLIARQSGRACTKEKLLAHVWCDTCLGTDEELRAHVAALRSKIGRPELIETVEFVGYRLATRPRIHSEAIAPAIRGAG